MDTLSYQAVKIKLAHERMSLEKEIAVLQLKRNENIKKREKEMNKLSKTQEIFNSNKVVLASMLKVEFNSEIVKNADREMLVINQYIQELNIEIEKINEREKFIEKTYELEQLQKMKKIQIKEEITIHEFKKWLGS